MTGPTKHAPGPWSIVDNRDMNGAYWIEAEHPEGFSVSIAEVRQGCWEAEEIGNVEANARIIAAAPLMLVALEGLAGLDRTPDEFATPEIRAARAVIAIVKSQAPDEAANESRESFLKRASDAGVPFASKIFNKADAARNAALREDVNDHISALGNAFNVVREETLKEQAAIRAELRRVAEAAGKWKAVRGSDYMTRQHARLDLIEAVDALAKAEDMP